MMKCSKSMLDRFSPTDEKILLLTKIYQPPSEREIPPYPFNAIGKPWHVSPSITRCRNNYHMFLGLSVNSDSV